MFIEVNTKSGVMLININGISCISSGVIYFLSGEDDCVCVKEPYEEIKSKIKAVGGVIECELIGKEKLKK